ncbi:YHS domain-containing (seleno)protein [Marispirochaeta sp.]|uniref:YHS domain-containing (seleno)protein n=1 Tax=Marispirochaeta sp. TaxID=2038653 RepID=UPI0029C60831|nr:YHS domain-containing (seleno)protein [Marispirochaeta sp.]
MYIKKKAYSVLLCAAFTFSFYSAFPVVAQTYGNRLSSADTVIAIQGFDPVSYFDTGIPEKGSPDFISEYQNLSWCFSSVERMRLFNRDPEKYIPQFNGKCSWAVTQKFLAEGNPSVWSIHNDRLYLFFSEGTKRQFEKEWEHNLNIAQHTWNTFLSGINH